MGTRRIAETREIISNKFKSSVMGTVLMSLIIGVIEYIDFFQSRVLFKVLEVPVVPIVALDYALSNDIDEIVKMATIKSNLAPEVWAEGIVIRPYQEKIDLLLSNENFNNGRVSFKAINVEFLIKYGE